MKKFKTIFNAFAICLPILFLANCSKENNDIEETNTLNSTASTLASSSSVDFDNLEVETI